MAGAETSGTAVALEKHAVTQGDRRLLSNEVAKGMRATLRVTLSIVGALAAMALAFVGTIRLQLAYFGWAAYEHDVGAGFGSLMISVFISFGVAMAVFYVLFKSLKRRLPPA